MFRLLRFIAVGVLSTALAPRVSAQATPAPPEWKDNAPSVYSQSGEKTQPTAAPIVSSKPAALPAAPITKTATGPARETAASTKLDSGVVPSAHVEISPPGESSSRRLAPPSHHAGNEKIASQSGRANASSQQLIDFGIPTQSIYTIVTALAIVVGAFLIFAWTLRRAGRGAGGRRAILPAGAVTVLGRVPLAARQVAELLRVGNKLVLVAVTAGGAETLTEITDPVEVDRLVGLCQQHDRHSTTQAFEQVFQNLSRESDAADGYFGAESLPSSISPVAAAYRSQRGGSGRG